MPLTPNSAATLARASLKEIIDAEFTDVPLVARNDRLDATMGMDGSCVGLYPLRQYPNSSERLELIVEIGVQFYGRWETEGDPTRVVNPAAIEAWADRFTQAVGAYHGHGTSFVWWFSVDRIEYPHDPTGNMTRFEATVLAHGNNPSP